MKISVIVPVYNAELTLTDCVRAVLDQSYTDLELILINDGSRDGSGELCDQFAAQDARVQTFYQENKGVSAARNLGLAKATGTFVAFLDADDVVPQDYLQILHSACQDADIAVCDVAVVQDGYELSRFTLPEGYLTQREALNFLLSRKKINSGPGAKLYRREVLQGLMYPPLKAYEDILFARDAFSRAERIAVTDRTEYRYVQNPEGAMSGFHKTPSTDIILAAEDLLEWLSHHRNLDPACIYITVSHLMQYAKQMTEKAEGRYFVQQTRSLYRKYLREIWGCSAFPWKEKIVYTLFTCGWLYADRTIKWIGG